MSIEASEQFKAAKAKEAYNAARTQARNMEGNLWDIADKFSIGRVQHTKNRSYVPIRDKVTLISKMDKDHDSAVSDREHRLPATIRAHRSFLRTLEPEMAGQHVTEQLADRAKYDTQATKPHWVNNKLTSHIVNNYMEHPGVTDDHVASLIMGHMGQPGAEMLKPHLQSHPRVAGNDYLKSITAFLG